MPEDTAIDPIYLKLKGHGTVELIPDFRALRRAVKLWAAQGVSPETSVIDCAPALMYACSPQHIRAVMTPDEFEGLLPMNAHHTGKALMLLLNDTEAQPGPQVAHLTGDVAAKPNGIPAPPVDPGEAAAGIG